MSKIEADAETATGGLVERLKQRKAALEGETISTTLPQTGVQVTWPAFKPHAVWMKAQRVAKKNPTTTPEVYVSLLCRFDGERLTSAELQTLLPTDDITHLVDRVMDDNETDSGGDGDDGADEGNALH